MVFIIFTDCVLCEVRPEILYIIYMNTSPEIVIYSVSGCRVSVLWAVTIHRALSYNQCRLITNNVCNEVETQCLYSHSKYAAIISGFTLLASREYQVVLEGVTTSLAINVILLTVKSVPQPGCFKSFISVAT